jgi:RNase H-fold protein (predicted Holliday junction resolvase)
MRTYVGIDPGLVKCGYAVVTTNGQRLALEIVPTKDLAERFSVDASHGSIDMVCVGNATRSQAVVTVLQSRWPSLPITLVDERNTSLEARRRFYEDHPPRGIMRFIPRGLLVPKEPLDGYAALLIVERYRESLARQASTGKG